VTPTWGENPFFRALVTHITHHSHTEQITVTHNTSQSHSHSHTSQSHITITHHNHTSQSHITVTYHTSQSHITHHCHTSHVTVTHITCHTHTLYITVTHHGHTCDNFQKRKLYIIWRIFFMAFRIYHSYDLWFFPHWEKCKILEKTRCYFNFFSENSIFLSHLIQNCPGIETMLWCILPSLFRKFPNIHKDTTNTHSTHYGKVTGIFLMSKDPASDEIWLHNFQKGSYLLLVF
jgi:hypothetical protein